MRIGGGTIAAGRPADGVFRSSRGARPLPSAMINRPGDENHEKPHSLALRRPPLTPPALSGVFLGERRLPLTPPTNCVDLRFSNSATQRHILT